MYLFGEWEAKKSQGKWYFLCRDHGMDRRGCHIGHQLFSGYTKSRADEPQQEKLVVEDV